MAVNDMTIRIGGAAGDGVESSGAGFAQALAQGGLLGPKAGRCDVQLGCGRAVSTPVRTTRKQSAMRCSVKSPVRCAGCNASMPCATQA